MRKNKLPNIVILLILTAITSIFWISFSVYNVFTKEEEYQIPNKIIAPLPPTLDIKTLEEINKRF